MNQINLKKDIDELEDEQSEKKLLNKFKKKAVETEFTEPTNIYKNLF